MYPWAIINGRFTKLEKHSSSLLYGPFFVHSSIPSFILYSVNISARPTVEAWAQKEIRHSTCPYQTHILVWLSRDLKVIRCQVVL